MIAIAASLTKASLQAKEQGQNNEKQHYKSKIPPPDANPPAAPVAQHDWRGHAPGETVTIGQQIVETCIRRPKNGRNFVNQISEKNNKNGKFTGLPRSARLPIYLRLQLRYEKICKSARMMALAGGEF